MGYMASEFAPEIQINFGGMILEFISKALKHAIPKVQYKGVLCIVNFEQGLINHKDVTVIQPYLPSLLSDMAAIFERAMAQPNFIMLEAVQDFFIVEKVGIDDILVCIKVRLFIETVVAVGKHG
jgi:hypothetical protein